ncbi:MAG: N-methyl-D-aspartate receptor NMDAR2C subunit [Cyanothece sp. SIO1E1]|nr:N-methyl-D-aspartate receptor NMDAR2C subunit [Cyanothece sp. SIO1E1]
MGSHQFSRQNLERALNGIGITPKVNLYDDLAAVYGESSRHYHTSEHVSACLCQWERYQSLAEKPYELAVAFWFHDAVYDTRRSDNEAQSAHWAERYLVAERADSSVVSRIVEMILATKMHYATEPDSRLMIDIDLSILGAPKHVFERYDQAIRREYDWVPEQQYRTARQQVLKTFLDRDVIYQTQALHQRYERQARENLTRKIESLCIPAHKSMAG